MRHTWSIQRSALRCPHLIGPRVCCPLISAAEKEAPYSGKSQSRLPCYTPAAAFLPLTAPCHQGRVVQALPHTATASLPDLLLRATGQPQMLCTQVQGFPFRSETVPWEIGMNLSHLLPIGPTLNLFEHNLEDPEVLGRIDGWWQRG